MDLKGYSLGTETSNLVNRKDLFENWIYQCFKKQGVHNILYRKRKELKDCIDESDCYETNHFGGLAGECSYNTVATDLTDFIFEQVGVRIINREYINYHWICDYSSNFRIDSSEEETLKLLEGLEKEGYDSILFCTTHEILNWFIENNEDCLKIKKVDDFTLAIDTWAQGREYLYEVDTTGALEGCIIEDAWDECEGTYWFCLGDKTYLGLSETDNFDMRFRPEMLFRQLYKDGVLNVVKDEMADFQNDHGISILDEFWKNLTKRVRPTKEVLF